MLHKIPFFGYSPAKYDLGIKPSCSMNKHGLVVEVHESQNHLGGLWWWLGRLDGISIEWRAHDSLRNDSGFNPSVGVNGSGQVIEVHDSGGGALWYWSGAADRDGIDWIEHNKFDSGVNPCVAINDSGLIVEVHKTNDPFAASLWWWVGRMHGNTIDWVGHGPLAGDSGYNPAVSINNNGRVLEVHESGGGELWFWIGQVVGDSIVWNGHGKYDSGVSPSIALADDDYLVEVHQSELAQSLWQRAGQIEGAGIRWFDYFGQRKSSYYFDDGMKPSVSIGCDGKAAIQAHGAGNLQDLHATASLVFDRANWMGDQLDDPATRLRGRRLNQIVLPASHDAGMYLDSVESILGRTQDLDIYGQLLAGVRYFDLRVENKGGGKLDIHHGIVSGPSFDDVLRQVRRFMAEGHRELLFLKLSHFKNFENDPAAFTSMCDSILNDSTGLGPWLCEESPKALRLACLKLGYLLQDRGVVMAVCDNVKLASDDTETDAVYPLPNSALASGKIYTYRNWESSHCADGQLTVFDVFSNTADYEKMKRSTLTGEQGLPVGQLIKFSLFTGKCRHEPPEVPCDLLLLSWTITTPTGVALSSRVANAGLAGDLLGFLPADGLNPAKLPINLLYVDYAQYSRVCDVSLLLNRKYATAPINGFRCAMTKIDGALSLRRFLEEEGADPLLGVRRLQPPQAKGSIRLMFASVA